MGKQGQVRGLAQGAGFTGNFGEPKLPLQLAFHTGFRPFFSPFPIVLTRQGSLIAKVCASVRTRILGWPQPTESMHCLLSTSAWEGVWLPPRFLLLQISQGQKCLPLQPPGLGQ